MNFHILLPKASIFKWPSATDDMHVINWANIGTIRSTGVLEQSSADKKEPSDGFIDLFPSGVISLLPLRATCLPHNVFYFIT
jgi:hypothetical protein